VPDAGACGVEQMLGAADQLDARSPLELSERSLVRAGSLSKMPADA
jgi:hypothetical protein